MIGIYKIRSKTGLVEYFENHLSPGEYYAEKGKVQGRWAGKLAEQMVLDTSQVKFNDFEKLASSKNPRNGKNLTVRQKSDRVVGYDLVISPPKSVSIMAITLEDGRLLQAHERASQIAFKEVEKNASTLVRKLLPIGHKKTTRLTGNLIAAQFTHTSNRDLDPQLHTHTVVFNATYDPVEKRVKALEATNLYNKTTYFTEVYRNALASEVRALGYEIEEGRYTWKIKGVSLELENLFSKGTQRINEEAKRIENELGIKVSGRGRAHIAFNSRDSKKTELEGEALIASHLAQMSFEQSLLFTAS